MSNSTTRSTLLLSDTPCSLKTVVILPNIPFTEGAAEAVSDWLSVDVYEDDLSTYKEDANGGMMDSDFLMQASGKPTMFVMGPGEVVYIRVELSNSQVRLAQGIEEDSHTLLVYTENATSTEPLAIDVGYTVTLPEWQIKYDGNAIGPLDDRSDFEAGIEYDGNIISFTGQSTNQNFSITNTGEATMSGTVSVLSTYRRVSGDNSEDSGEGNGHEENHSCDDLHAFPDVDPYCTQGHEVVGTFISFGEESTYEFVANPNASDGYAQTVIFTVDATILDAGAYMSILHISTNDMLYPDAFLYVSIEVMESLLIVTSNQVEFINVPPTEVREKSVSVYQYAISKDSLDTTGTTDCPSIFNNRMVNLTVTEWTESWLEAAILTPNSTENSSTATLGYSDSVAVTMRVRHDFGLGVGQHVATVRLQVVLYDACPEGDDDDDDSEEECEESVQAEQNIDIMVIMNTIAGKVDTNYTFITIQGETDSDGAHSNKTVARAGETVLITVHPRDEFNQTTSKEAEFVSRLYNKYGVLLDTYPASTLLVEGPEGLAQKVIEISRTSVGKYHFEVSSAIYADKIITSVHLDVFPSNIDGSASSFIQSEFEKPFVAGEIKSLTIDLKDQYGNAITEASLESPPVIVGIISSEGPPSMIDDGSVNSVTSIVTSFTTAGTYTPPSMGGNVVSGSSAIWTDYSGTTASADGTDNGIATGVYGYSTPEDYSYFESETSFVGLFQPNNSVLSVNITRVGTYQLYLPYFLNSVAGLTAPATPLIVEASGVEKTMSTFSISALNNIGYSETRFSAGEDTIVAILHLFDRFGNQVMPESTGDSSFGDGDITQSWDIGVEGVMESSLQLSSNHFTLRVQRELDEEEGEQELEEGQEEGTDEVEEGTDEVPVIIDFVLDYDVSSEYSALFNETKAGIVKVFVYSHSTGNFISGSLIGDEEEDFAVQHESGSLSHEVEIGPSDAHAASFLTANTYDDLYIDDFSIMNTSEDGSAVHATSVIPDCASKSKAGDTCSVKLYPRDRYLNAALSDVDDNGGGMDGNDLLKESFTYKCIDDNSISFTAQVAKEIYSLDEGEKEYSVYEISFVSTVSCTYRRDCVSRFATNEDCPQIDDLNTAGLELGCCADDVDLPMDLEVRSSDAVAQDLLGKAASTFELLDDEIIAVDKSIFVSIELRDVYNNAYDGQDTVLSGGNVTVETFPIRIQVWDEEMFGSDPQLPLFEQTFERDDAQLNRVIAGFKLRDAVAARLEISILENGVPVAIPIEKYFDVMPGNFSPEQSTMYFAAEMIAGSTFEVEVHPCDQWMNPVRVVRDISGNIINSILDDIVFIIELQDAASQVALGYFDDDRANYYRKDDSGTISIAYYDLFLSGSFAVAVYSVGIEEWSEAKQNIDSYIGDAAYGLIRANEYFANLTETAAHVQFNDDGTEGNGYPYLRVIPGSVSTAKAVVCFGGPCMSASLDESHYEVTGYSLPPLRQMTIISSSEHICKIFAKDIYRNHIPDQSTDFELAQLTRFTLIVKDVLDGTYSFFYSEYRSTEIEPMDVQGESENVNVGGYIVDLTFNGLGQKRFFLYNGYIDEGEDGVQDFHEFLEIDWDGDEDAEDLGAANRELYDTYLNKLMMAFNATILARECVGSGVVPTQDGMDCECAAGFSWSVSQCSACPAGMFKSGQGNATECVKCAGGFTTTMGTASSSEEDCICEGGYFMDQVDGENMCVPCLDGATCYLGSDISTLQVDSGKWRSSQQSKYIIDCPVSAACKGGSIPSSAGNASALCAEGYTGILCGVCEDGYKIDPLGNGMCEKCDEDGSDSMSKVGMWVVFSLAIAVLFVGREWMHAPPIAAARASTK